MARGAITVKIDGQYDDKDINRAIKDLNALKSQAEPTTGAFGKLGDAWKSIGIAAAAFGGFAVVTDFLQSSMQAAIEDEKSMVALATAMKNVGAGAQTAGIEAYITKMMLATGVADDKLRPAFQKLVTATGDAALSQDLLATAMDVSAATGKDLETVSLAIAKAANGNIGALTRLGVPLDQNIVKTKDFGAAVDTLNAKFGGQAAAAADTYGGQLARVQAAAGEAQESIGYALLGAIDNLSASFGGTGGAVEMITAFGEELGGIITTIGDGVTVITTLMGGIEGLITDIGNAVGATELWGSIVSGVWDATISTIAGPFYQLGKMYQAGKADADAAATAVVNHGLSASRTAPLLAQLAASEQAQADAAADAKAATDALRASIDRFNSTISQSQARDDFRKSISDIDVALKGNSRSFKGVSDAAKENRDTLRTMLGEAGQIATDWGRETGASADEVDAKYKAMRKKIIAGFKAEGFTTADIKAFMGKEHLWRTPAQDAVQSAATAATSVARPSFLVVGRDVASGAAAGINQNAWMVAQAARIMMLRAKGAAEAAVEIKSPSKVFAEIGGNVVDGLVEGMKSKNDKVSQAATEMMQAILDKAGDIVQGWDDKIAKLKDRLDTAKGLVAEWATGMQQKLMSGFDIGAAYTAAIGENGQVSAEKWISGVDAQIAQMEWFGNVLAAIQKNGGPNSQALVDYLASKGAATGGAMGQALIDNGLVQTMADKMFLVQDEATTMANSMVPPYLLAGVASAQATYDGFYSNFGKGKPARVAMENLMDRIADSLERTVTVTVQTVYEAAGIKGARALGGPVTAGDAWLVGEKGPEVFVPNTAGNIIPNGGLPLGSGGFGRGSAGAVYNINVAAGVGDPRQIGQQVVEYIKRFESASGKVFAAA